MFVYLWNFSFFLFHVEPTDCQVLGDNNLLTKMKALQSFLSSLLTNIFGLATCAAVAEALGALCPIMRNQNQNTIQSTRPCCGTPRHPTSLMTTWCCQAWSTSIIDCKGSQQFIVSLRSCQEDIQSHVASPAPRKQLRDVSSPRLWLEHHPDGVYTVIRVELEQQEQVQTQGWSIWGLEFHLDRLEYSYARWSQVLIENNRRISRAAFNQARQETRHVLFQLLREAGIYMNRSTDSPSEASKEMIYMGTILWHPQNEDRIQVRGHITRYLYFPIFPIQPIVATLAVLPSNKGTISNLSLPSRRRPLGLADCKFSSWCRERRPLEAEFPIPWTNSSLGFAAHEIILTDVSHVVDRNGGRPLLQVQLLEGLTSNLFLVYPNRVVRTSSSPFVLPGFARSMALICLQHFGYAIDTNNTICAGYTLSEKSIAEALSSCEEVFVTSSVKLVAPVHAIFINRTMVWSQRSSVEGLCDRLLCEILIRKQDFVTLAGTRTEGEVANATGFERYGATKRISKNETGKRNDDVES